MNSARERRSLLMPQKRRPTSPELLSPEAMARLNPVPTGIDEDEIGEAQPGLRVVDQPGRRCGNRAVVVERKPPGPERAHVQPGRTRARAAVEHERDRARGRVLAVLSITDVKHGGLGVALVLPHPQRSGGGDVIELAAVDRDRVLRAARANRSKQRQWKRLQAALRVCPVRKTACRTQRARWQSPREATNAWCHMSCVAPRACAWYLECLFWRQRTFGHAPIAFQPYFGNLTTRW